MNDSVRVSVRLSFFLPSLNPGCALIYQDVVSPLHEERRSQEKRSSLEVSYDAPLL